MISFENDYSEGASEKILQRLIETNMEQLSGYGNDRYCESAKEKIRKACGCPEAEIYFLSGGTQTNRIVISSMLQPYEGVIAAQTGHVSSHEAGAIESSGHKVLTLPQHDGKIEPEELADYLNDFYGDGNHEHMVFPGMVYISHPTEYGTLYTKGELAELADICLEYHIPLYLDGARLGYALAADTNYSAQDWFEMEWAWARGTNKYSGTPNGLDLQGLGTDVLANYSLTNMPKDPAEDDSRDLPLEGMTATAGSEQATTGSEGPASAVLDQTTGTIWHSKWSGDARENLWIDIALGESKTVTGLRMLPRSGGGNGTITSYRIEISNDHGKTYQEVATGTWNSSDSWKMAEFHAIQATNVRLYAVESVSDTSNIFASAAEIRIMGPATAIVPAEETIVNIATPSKEADLSSAQAAKETDKYTVSTVWKDATGTTVTAISKDKNATHDYTAKITLTPVTGYSFDKTSVPDTLTLKLNDQRTVEAIPVTDSVLNDDGTVTITYQFSNMFQGGSLRMDQSSPEKSTNMRFGYDFKLPEASSEKDEISFKGCTWYYGVAEDDLKNTFSPDKTNFITNPDKKGAEYYRSNIVFTNLSSGAYKRSVYARILVKYTVNGKERSVMGTFVDSRSVSMIVEGILANTNADQTEKDYALKIKDAILK